MKKWFAAALLLLAVAYTAFGVSTLTLTTPSGRPAAGFFPLLVGVALIIACAANLLADWREWRREAFTGAPPLRQLDPATEASGDAIGVDLHGLDGRRQYGRDVLIVFALIVLFVALLKVLGALLSMIVFMLAFLFIFNRSHPVSNILYSLLLPGFLYGLFKVLLNASLPTGPFGF